MKTIIAGSRTIDDYSQVESAVKQSGFTITELYSGCAKGVDMLGIMYADANKIPVMAFPAQWDKHGKKAGILRNEEMAKTADALIAIWDGKSRGTKHMIQIAKEKNLKVFVYLVE